MILRGLLTYLSVKELNHYCTKPPHHMYVPCCVHWNMVAVSHFSAIVPLSADVGVSF